jgi:hypothetical protein
MYHSHAFAGRNSFENGIEQALLCRIFSIL